LPNIDRLTLLELIDQLYDYFRGTRFVGELVFVDVPTATGNERQVERAFIREKLPNTEPITLEKKLNDKRQMARDLKDEQDIDMSKVPEDHHHYRIQLFNYPLIKVTNR
jgi:hypothetical protein